MKIKRNWWIWLGLGLFFLIAFKFTVKEQFTKAPLGNHGSVNNDKIMKKVTEVMALLGYENDKKLELRLGSIIVGPNSEFIKDVYEKNGENLTKDQLVTVIYNDPKVLEKDRLTKFSSLKNQDDIRFINVLHKYLTNYPPVPIDQPVSLIRLV
jgi:hypothetical protein